METAKIFENGRSQAVRLRFFWFRKTLYGRLSWMDWIVSRMTFLKTVEIRGT